MNIPEPPHYRREQITAMRKRIRRERRIAQVKVYVITGLVVAAVLSVMIFLVTHGYYSRGCYRRW